MNLLQTNWRRAIPIAVAYIVWTGASFAQTEDEVLESYEASLDLPDAIAFRQFLELQRPSSEQADVPDLRIVARALGIKPDESGAYDHAYPYAEVFAKANSAMKREIVINTDARLCRQDRTSMSERQIGNAMNDAHYIADDAANEQYLAVRSSLSVTEQEALQAYLDEVKLGTSYVRYDFRTRPGDIRADLEQWCAELVNEKLELGINR